jgi:hypothetical protein
VRGRKALALGAVMGVLIGLAPIADVLGWASLSISAVILGTIALRTPAVRGPLLVAFMLRAGAALVQWYVTPLPASDADAIRFEAMGYDLARLGVLGVLEQLTRVEHVYAWIIGVLYALTDRSPLMIQVLNVLLGTLVVWNVFALARLLWGDDAARRAAWVAAVLPTPVLFSAIILREVMIVYPLTLGVLWLARWYVTNGGGYLLGAFVAFSTATAFHVFAFTVVGAAALVVLVRWFSLLTHGKPHRALATFVAGLVVLAAFSVALAYGWSRYEYLEAMMLRSFQVQQEFTSAQRAGYLEDMTVTSPAALVWQAPIRMVYFLLMPFPWRVSAAVDVVGLLDALVYLGLLWYLLRGARRIWSNGPARASLFLAMTAITVFSLAVSNYGTAIRHRAKVAPILIAVAAVAMVRPAGARRETEQALSEIPAP